MGRAHAAGDGRVVADGVDARWAEDGVDGVDWAFVYPRHADALRRLLAHRLPRGAPVDDLLQETFARAIRSTPRIDTSRPVWPFLATVAGRTVADWWRGEGIAGQVAAPYGAPAADFPGSDEHASALDRVIGARRALRALPPRHRRVLLLYEGADTTYEELVALDRVTPTALKSLLARARASFRAHYRAMPVAVGWAQAVLRRLRQRYDRWQAAVPWEGVATLGGAVAVGMVAAGVLVLPDGPSSSAPRASVVARGVHATYVAHERPSSPSGATAVPAGVGAVVAPPGDGRGAGRARHGRTVDAGAGPVAAGTGLATTDKSSTASYVVTITLPIGPTEHHVGMEARCDQGQVAARQCEVLRALPSDAD